MRRVKTSDSELAQWENMKSPAETWALTGRALADYTSPDETLVAGAVGAIGYYSNLCVLPVSRCESSRNPAYGWSSSVR